jgi:hypothetical protein
MLALLSVHNVIIIVLGVSNIQNVEDVKSTEVHSHTVHVFSICTIMPEFVKTVLSNVTVVLLLMNVTYVHQIPTDMMNQLVTVLMVFMKSMMKLVQNVPVNVLPVLDPLTIV